MKRAAETMMQNVIEVPKASRLESTEEMSRSVPVNVGALRLRGYQQRIVNSISEKNTVVLLPTGAGKTLIAAECARVMGKTLFLVPTCLLVEQQAAAIRLHTGLQVAEYMGGKKLQPFDILVSTPEAFRIAQRDRSEITLQWAYFGLIVFDEVHHVLKHHPYHHLATSLYTSTSSPRIVGLSASLTYEVNPKAMEKQITQLCNELKIDCIATAELAELQEHGYHATQIPMEVKLPTFDLPTGLIPATARLPHLMHKSFFDRIRSGTATSFACALVEAIRAMETTICLLIPSFKSPLAKASLKEWGMYAHSLANRSPLCAEMEFWYEALRLVVSSWEEAADAAVMFLQMNNVVDTMPSKVVSWPVEAARVRERFFEVLRTTSLVRFEHLKDCLTYKLDNTESFRGVLFVNMRITAHILEYVLSSDVELSLRLRPTVIYAAGSPATASLTLSKREVASRIAAFASGEVNLLISTVVAEEGMDIPAANCVMRFDSMVHAVSMVQGRGRARQADSSFIVLSERTDRPATKLKEVEQLQHKLVSSMQLNRSSGPDMGALRAAQTSREFTAQSVLLKEHSVASLMEYCQKTKVGLGEYFCAVRGGWRCDLSYESVLRQLTCSQTSSTRKAAKSAAAVQLLQAIVTDGGRVG